MVCAERRARPRMNATSVAIPVDMTMGLPVAAIRRIRGRSTSSAEATLYAGASRDSSSSTAVGSNGLENGTSPSERARANSGSCHFVAGLVQFFLFASESWFFVMAIDLFLSVGERMRVCFYLLLFFLVAQSVYKLQTEQNALQFQKVSRV